MKTIEEKSLMLAELMGWKIITPTNKNIINSRRVPTIMETGGMRGLPLMPYKKSPTGLAQAAAIFFKFPKVMTRFVSADCDEGGFNGFVIMNYEHYQASDEDVPTQSNILDEILRMNGKEID